MFKLKLENLRAIKALEQYLEDMIINVKSEPFYIAQDTLSTPEIESYEPVTIEIHEVTDTDKLLNDHPAYFNIERTIRLGKQEMKISPTFTLIEEEDEVATIEIGWAESWMLESVKENLYWSERENAMVSQIFMGGL